MKDQQPAHPMEAMAQMIVELAAMHLEQASVNQ